MILSSGSEAIHSNSPHVRAMSSSSGHNLHLGVHEWGMPAASNVSEAFLQPSMIMMQDQLW